jgi:flagellar biosynthesis/type III secretory pathway protein FliH
MAILSGLVSKELPRMLLGRRRDIMIESAAYDLIKEEGFKEGMQKGMQQGMEQGMQQGMRQGMRQGLIDALEARFELVSRSIAAIIQEIDEPTVLKALHKKSVTIDSLDSFREALGKVLDQAKS